MEQIRVIVIDDSAFMRKVITDILESDSRIRVVGTARNGEDGIRKIEKLKPDVVTLDIEMPVMDGMTALKLIMKTNPLPVVMLTSVSEADTTKTIEAMSCGAVDFISKPSGPISLDLETIKHTIITKVITAAQINVQKSPSKNWTRKWEQPSFLENDKTIVGIGTSTGGPKALQQVLQALPENFPAPIVIVQHMPPGFTKSLADRLDTICTIRVKEAENGEPLTCNTAYIAPGNYHLGIDESQGTLRIKLHQSPPENGHRPSVDVLFESLSLLRDVNKIGVVLTGMGSDGTKGARKMKSSEKNTILIAEAEETAVVYGMPKSIVKSGLADYILPLNEIGDFLTKLAMKC